MRQNEGAVKWLLGDHLGSTSLVYDGSQAIRQGYKAWGERRFILGAEELPTTFRYTGQREEASIGLYYYGARWYDALLGRWIQSDTDIPESQDGNGNISGWNGTFTYSPLVVGYYEYKYLENLNNENTTRNQDFEFNPPPIPTNSAAFDRYAYILDNPILYNDPSGHLAALPVALALITTLGWAVIGVTIAACVVYLAVPAIRPAVTNAIYQVGNTVSSGLNVLFATKADVKWGKYIKDKYGLTEDEWEWNISR